MTEILVVKGRTLVVQNQEVEGGTGLVDDGDAFVRLQARQVVVVDLDDEVDLAGLKGDGAGRTFGDDAVGQVLDGGSAFEVIFKSLELDLVAQGPLDELIRAGADRIGVEIVALVQQLLGHGIVRSHIIQRLGVDFLRMDVEGQIVDDFDAVPEVGIGSGEGLLLTGELHGGLDVLSGQDFAVMELDAFAELELPGLVVQGLPGLDQLGLDLQGVDVVAEQGVVGQDVHVAAGDCGMQVGSHRGRLVGGSDDDIIAGGSVRGGLGRLALGRLALGALLVVGLSGLGLFLAAAGGEQGQRQNRDQNQAQELLHACSPF